MSQFRIIAGCFCCLLSAGLASSQAQPPASVGKISVSGRHLLRDGKVWTAHGYFQIAFTVPPAAFSLPGTNPVFVEAYNNYSPSEYSDMRAAGADSVRLTLSQNASDPENPNYDGAFLQRAIGAIQAAREVGLTVIVAVQDEAQGTAKAELPDAATERVWRLLTPFFGRDRGVMFELYNEPNVDPTATATTPPTKKQWEEWAAAMNKVITEVRALGSVNVIVADGLVDAQQLTGAPALDDPLQQVAYASHPYPVGPGQGIETSWAQKFGDFAQTAPVIITEWGVGYYCNSHTPESVVKFLSYLKKNDIGLEAVAWDWDNYRFASARQGRPGVFSSLLTPAIPSGCTAANHNAPGEGSGPGTAFGPGKAIETWYLTGDPPSRPE